MRKVIKATSIAVTAILLFAVFAPLCVAAMTTACTMPCCRHTSTSSAMAKPCGTPCAVSADDSTAPLPAVTGSPVTALPIAVIATSETFQQPQSRIARPQASPHRGPELGLYLLNSVLLI